jgi:hypothetical protein
LRGAAGAEDASIVKRKAEQLQLLWLDKKIAICYKFMGDMNAYVYISYLTTFG